MSIQEEQQTGRKKFPTRSVLLILLVVAGTSAVAYGIAYGLNNTLAPASAHSDDYYRFGGHPGPYWGRNNATSTFLAASRVDDVTVTGFSITSSSQVSVTLSYGGTGTAPAVTLVALSPGLSGSNTLSAGWGPTTTTTLSLVGGGSLSTTWHVALLVMPFTGA